MSKLNSIDIGNYFSFIRDTGDLTNLKIQKLVYYASGFYNVLHKNKLFKENIEAWDYGPVVPSLYHSYKGFKYHSVLVEDFNIDKIDIHIRCFLNDIYKRYSKYSAKELVDMTHFANTPWYLIYYDDSYDYVINDHLMMVYFTEYAKQQKLNPTLDEIELIKLLSNDNSLSETMYLVKDRVSADSLISALDSSESNEVIQFDYKNAS